MRSLVLLLCLAALPAHAGDPDVLWKLVSQKCLPAAMRGEPPKPCTSVDLARGVAVLKDIEGVAQYLVIPTTRVTGMEDREVLDDGATFEVGWESRSDVEAKLGHALPRDAVSLAVNSEHARSQNQLHLHVDCLDASFRPILAASRPGPEWSVLPAPLAGHQYIARWIDGDSLAGVNPYRLLADYAKGPIGGWTIAAVGATSPAGKPGIILLAQNELLAHSEELQDHTCHGY